MENYYGNEEAGFGAEENIITISILNKATGATYRDAAVRPDNTLGQILEEYGQDVGMNLKKRVLFTNKRTGETTVNVDSSVRDFDLQEGDVLTLLDDCAVA